MEVWDRPIVHQALQLYFAFWLVNSSPVIQVVEIPEGHIFEKSEAVHDLVEGFDLENIPNRNSTEYTKIYNIESARTVYRGTLRYKVGRFNILFFKLSTYLARSLIQVLIPDKMRLLSIRGEIKMVACTLHGNCLDIIIIILSAL